MVSAIRAADFFVQEAVRDGIPDMTNLKLNKLLYFAQVISLQKTGKPLFPEDIEAWDYGPVVRDVYFEFKDNDNRPIREPSAAVNDSMFTQEEKDILTDAFVALAENKAYPLMARTHKNGSPWDKVYNSGLPRHGRNRVIPVDLIKQDEPVISEKLMDVNECELVAPDSEGRLTIPEDWDK